MSAVNKEFCCNEIRCRKCNRLLMKGKIKDIEVKCPKCGSIQIFKDIGCDSKKLVDA